MRQLVFLALILLNSPSLWSNTIVVDSLLTKLTTTDNDSIRVDLFNEIAYASYRSKPQLTLEYANKAIEMATTIGYDYGKVMGLKNMGIGQVFLNEPKKALAAFEEVTRVSEEKGFKKTLHKALNNSGNLYMDLGNMEAATSAYQRASLIAKMEGDEADYCLYSDNLAGILVQQGELKKAYRTYSNIYAIANRLKNKTLIADISSGMAEVLLKEKKYEECLEFYSKALNLYTVLEAKGGIILTLMNIGEVHDTNDDGKSALQFYNRALKIAHEFGASVHITTCYEAIAESSLKNGKYRLAISNAKLGLDHAEKANNINIKKAFYEVLTQAYEGLGGYQKGLIYHKKLKTLEDSLRVSNEAQKIAELQLEYEDQTREIENGILREKQSSHELELKKNKWIAILIGLALILMTGMACIFYRINQEKGKYNISLQKEVDNRTQALERSNVELKKSNKELERFSHIASHDLKEPLRNITSFIRLIERRLTGENEYLKEYLQFVQNNAKQMHLLIEDVLEFSQVKKNTGNLESVDLEMLIKQVKIALRQLMKKDHVVIEHSKLPTIYSDKGQMYLVLKNIIENGIRFNKNPIKHIKIIYKEVDGHHLFSIKDNGIGIDKTYHEKIFEMFERLQNRQHYRGSGLGLSLCKKIIAGMKGQIWVESNTADGSTFQIKIPVRLPTGAKREIRFGAGTRLEVERKVQVKNLEE